jgi:hypothetical protein
MSLFEIDEALDLLIVSAAEQAAEGEMSDELRNALSQYVDAFGEKVDRIVNYIKAQEAFADAAKKESARLEARRKSAENCVNACKAFVCWFMNCRSLKHLKGHLNTVTLAANSADTLVIDQVSTVPQAFVTVMVSIPWLRWEELLSYVPEGALRSDLVRQASGGNDLDRSRISEAIKAGQIVPGARLIRGQHIRLR